MKITILIIQFLTACFLGYSSSAIVFHGLVGAGIINEDNASIFQNGFYAWFFGGSLWVLLPCVMLGLCGFIVKNLLPRLLLLWMPAIGPFIYTTIIVFRYLSS